MNEMDSIPEILKEIKEKGQGDEFKMDKCGKIIIDNKTYMPTEFELIKTYRFEGDSDPAEQAIIYVIKSVDGKFAYSLESYGMYSNHPNDDYFNFIQHLEMKKK
jgi:hypothetical protein